MKSFILLLAISFVIFSCNKEVFNPQTATLVENIELDIDTNVIAPWSNTLLIPKVYGKNNFQLINLNNKIEWISSNPKIASIDSLGNLETFLIGEVEITTKIQDFSKAFKFIIKAKNNFDVSQNVYVDSVEQSVETSISINPTNPLNLAISANFNQYFSLNGGKNWQIVKPRTFTSQADPNTLFDRNGFILRQGMDWIQGENNVRGIKVDKSSIKEIGNFPNSQEIWAYKPLNGSGNADQGFMAIDNYVNSPYLGNIYVVFSNYPSKTPNYEIKGFSLIFIKSTDEGKTWSKPVDVSNSLKFRQEHSSSITTGPNGEIYISWWNLDGEVIFKKSLDGGETWSDDILVRKQVRINNFPQSDDVRGNITVAVDKSNGPYRGNIYISGADQNSTLGGASDAWIVSSNNNGESWGQTILLSDGPQGAFKYYFQPKIAVAPNGRIDAIWYDTRNWNGSDINEVDYDIYYTSSIDGGSSFIKNVRVSKNTFTKYTNCPNNQPCGKRKLYEYIGLDSDNNRAVAVWSGMVNRNKVFPFFATIWIND